MRPPEQLPIFKPSTNMPSRRTRTDDDAVLNHTIVTAFAAVLGQRDVNAIIEHLSAEAAYEDQLKPFFINEARKLAPFERVEDTVSKKSLARSGRRDFNVLAPQNPDETGSFGVIYRSEDGRRIYKSITIKAPEHIRTIAKKTQFFEEKIRNIFIETFIQTILVCDPDVGSNICRPLQLFRDPKTVSIAGPLDDTMTFYILMEPIKFTFRQFVDQKHGIQMDWFAPFLKEFGHILTVLKRKYNYTHRDLHSGNVMMDATGKIKLIDFGYSSLEFRGLHYHDIDKDELEDIKCTPGLDLAIFFTTLFYLFKAEIDVNPDVKGFFSDKFFLGSYDDDNYNMFELADATSKGMHAYPPHVFYHFLITPFIRNCVQNIPILKPEILEKVADGLITGVNFAPAITS